ncbi:MAG: hypothetical protein A2X87_04920 [Deltaproteobacteria bacterium GWC2_42_51]|nr:MAG: hypothetical protein A2056_01730 [Deltaproteobacteria bacterium GWA2_42_85]OGP31786.1 MAG: hypothetical protein A2X87_04920 [Deltaproteobacteria bacterium GWC2_42_51]OGP38823.1 MAG: hypothetical protein A2090_00365 [Deltaproteobacteria bacterium GWD2_42_10]OGP47017.1 MAG: hypothetical protein A2022_07070 [Deltaproteobacteria bacterium GWF2_42_12]OGQ24159.1 MAG: hypothetical protein A3D29_07765 [Deltaproteobacteria bacterium RIFCSPHIGHO2_02_FULL_42_44]OGQ36155.1 MAG: hypothetical protei
MHLFVFGALILYILSFFLVMLYRFTPSPLPSPSPEAGKAERVTGKELFELLSKSAIVIGLIFHTIALGIRTHESGHAPMLAMYETLLFFSWSTVLVSAIVILRYNERLTELITIPAAILAMIFAQVNEIPPKPLTLILKTWWFETHVITSFAAYALFTLAFAGAVLYLIYDLRAMPLRALRVIARSGSGCEAKPEQTQRFLASLGTGSATLTPDEIASGLKPIAMTVSDLKKDFQDIANRSILWGFFFFSASMFAGAVWAYLAWGTYWLWEPKVIWSFIVWFYYAGAMHAYYVKEWRGKGLAIATVIGFFVVLFTYLGVSLLMKSSHSF